MATRSEPEHQAEPEGRVHANSKLQRWHPKVTPYRLVILSTTIFLGTAKAVLTQLGRTVAPITIEWVSGVVLFLVLHAASSYDTEGELPPHISWFFNYDCMDIIWRISGLFSIPRPVYVSDERPSLLGKYSRHPPITIYRITVSLTAVIFGSAKAFLTYRGYSSAATWIDWFLGVYATTCLYVLGLYENNSAHFWSSFFAEDWSNGIFATFQVLKYISGIILCLAWSIGCIYMIPIYWNEPSLDLSYTKPGSNVGAMTPTFIDNTHDFCIRIMVSILIAVVGLSTLSGVEFFAREIGYITQPFSIRLAFRAARRRVLISIWNLVPSALSLAPRRIDSIITFLRVCMHIILHTIGVIACISMSIVWFGFSVRFRPPAPNSPENSFIVFLLLYAFLIASSIMGLVVLGVCGFVVIPSMIKPLHKYRRGGYKNSREFAYDLIAF